MPCTDRRSKQHDTRMQNYTFRLQILVQSRTKNCAQAFNFHLKSALERISCDTGLAGPVILGGINTPAAPAYTRTHTHIHAHTRTRWKGRWRRILWRIPWRILWRILWRLLWRSLWRILWRILWRKLWRKLWRTAAIGVAKTSVKTFFWRSARFENVQKTPA